LNGNPPYNELALFNKMTLNSTINILIVDDHSMMLNALKSLLPTDEKLRVVGTCGSGMEAERLYDELHPDIVIMDVYMKPMSGIEATQKILSHHPDAKIVGLSNFYSEKDAGELSQLGAKGYVIKIAPLQAITDCVKKVFAGELCFEKYPE
jgi:DNA-binding NarL/FixJ family response regulator